MQRLLLLRVAALPRMAALLAVALIVASPCDSAPPAPGLQWTTYHLNNDRTANDEAGPALRGAALAWTRGDLDGPVYAEPLVFRGSVYVVTESDSLYALSASNGRIEWRLRLAAPALSPVMHCTPLVPLGITSTPVIDPERARLYAAGVVDTVRG